MPKVEGFGHRKSERQDEANCILSSCYYTIDDIIYCLECDAIDEI
jgi:hypothetical protein